MFSQRVSWDLTPNPLSQLLESKRTAGVRVWDLTESNPTVAGFLYPPHVLAGLRHPGAVRYEPTPWGLGNARSTVVQYYQEHRVLLTANQVMLTASTSESYGYLFKLLCDAGDRILVPRPSYPLFEFLAALELVEVGGYELAYRDGWRVDFDSLLTAVDAKTKAIVVVNPNNPTGHYLSASDKQKLGRLCESRGIALIIDEVFLDYRLEGGGQASAAGFDGCLTFVMSGLSKVCALPQLKLGWIVISGPGGDEAGTRLELIADTYLSVGTPVQWALPALLEGRHEIQGQILYRVRRNLEQLRRVFGERVMRVQAGWYAMVTLPVELDEESVVLRALESSDVLLQPSFFYDMHSFECIVFSLLTEPPVFDEGLRRVAPLLAA